MEKGFSIKGSELPTHLLTDVLVLVETLFRQVTLSKIHAELQVFEHDGLVDLLPCSMFFAFNDIVQNIQGRLLLANLEKFCCVKADNQINIWCLNGCNHTNRKRHTLKQRVNLKVMTP